MKKRLIVCSIGALFISIALIFPMQSSQIRVVHAETSRKKVLTQPLMSLGVSLTEEQKTETKALLGDSQISDKQLISVTGETLAKYIGAMDASENIYSSAFIKPLEKGSGVRVEIVTPDKITMISAATYQNAAITSGVSDILIRIASVETVTGEGALAGVYALLERAGIEINQTTVQMSQDEMSLIEKMKTETTLSDDEANKLIAELKKNITTNLVNKKAITDDWLEKSLDDICASYQVIFSDGLKTEILAWLNSYSKTDAAKSSKTVKQLEQSILATEWAEVLTKLDTVLSPEEILALEKMDYSDEKVYHAIINAIYQGLLTEIEEGRLNEVKLIYSQSFVIEQMLSHPSVKEKEALNYIRTLCYYFIASKEDGKLSGALKQDKRPVWLVADTTKANFLYALNRYKNISQSPNLQEIVNRIALATGYAYEAFLYEDIQQDGDSIRLTIVCPCIDQKTKISVVYNLKTGECTLQNGKTTNKTKVYDFKKRYKVELEDKYQKLVDSLKVYQLSDKDIAIFNASNLKQVTYEAYKEVVEQYYNYSISSDTFPSNYSYLPILDDSTYPPGDRQFKYALFDMNRDGVDELIISDGDNNNLAVYTYNKRAILLKGVSGYRNHMQVFQDGKIVTYGSGGADVLGVTIYTLENADKGLVELHTLTREFNQSASQSRYIVGQYDSSTEIYQGQAEYLKQYGQYEQYLSIGSYTFIDSSLSAAILDLSIFRDISDRKVFNTSSEEKAFIKTEKKTSEYIGDLTEGDKREIEELVLKGRAYNDEIFVRDEKYIGLIPSALTEPAIHYETSDKFVTLAELTDAYNSYKAGTYYSDDILRIWKKRYDVEEVEGSYKDQVGPIFGSTEYGLKYYKGDQTFVLNHGGFGFSNSVHVLQEGWKIKKNYVDVPVAMTSFGQPEAITPNYIVRVKLNNKQYKGGSGQASKFYIENVRTIIDTKSDASYITWSTKQSKKVHEAIQAYGKKEGLTFQSESEPLSSPGEYQIAIFTDSSDKEPDIKTLYYSGMGSLYDYYFLSRYDVSDGSSIPMRYVFTIHDGKPVLLLNRQSDAGYQIPGTNSYIPTFTLVTGGLQQKFSKIFYDE
ncbi:TPA: DUF1002 domain-containing protein [Streptococcus suis]|uniref:DUF1002 domain-containing protein n=1 Tax=Streptococcus suis TaxID=1307 RepID=UPI002A7AE800|nr:DUF1002 domain-containing protein [Streptococcus suis]HEM3931414.1 DUF1002 domain-containing protein [Streptococcus suis]HEM3945927.1 DUF1002 domain-containing protein [Streptococcus suis]HEM3959929.1 DUF1002 domain-containing protein [Streptococcus suis]